MPSFKWLYILCIFILGINTIPLLITAEIPQISPHEELHLPLHNYEGEPKGSIEDIVVYRAEFDPLNLISTIIFTLAIIHTLLATKILAYAKSLEKKEGKTFKAEVIHFLGEVETIFGIWVIPLLLVITYFHGWNSAVEYLNSRNYTEVMVIVVIMTLAATYPITSIAEKGLHWLASWGGNTPTAWWLVLLTIGPLFGSFITEPGAITITGLLLAKHFYRYGVSEKLSYATLGLLFTNISVGGVLTSYAAPPILVAAKQWHWDTPFMLINFGWKAVIGIVLANALYFYYFRKEFAQLNKREKLHEGERETSKPVPLWITLVHILFLILVVIHLHDPVVFIGIFMIFLGFYEVTSAYQKPLNMRSPLLVGFFFGGLIIHGGLQEWWITPLLQNVGEWSILGIAMLLSPFNDNAAVTYLASLIPDLKDSLKYPLVVGAISVGGLTVIANAPNPAGQQILSSFFKGGISGKKLFYGAAIPALIMVATFLIFRM